MANPISAVLGGVFSLFSSAASIFGRPKKPAVPALPPPPKVEKVAPAPEVTKVNDVKDTKTTSSIKDATAARRRANQSRDTLFSLSKTGTATSKKTLLGE